MYIAIDIGGTSTRVAYSVDGKSLKQIEKFTTGSNYAEELQKITEVIDSFREGGELAGISIGFPGILSENYEEILVAPNVPAFEGAPLVHDLKHKYNTPVLMRNDTDLGGLAESQRFADARVVAYIAIGTGLGGVRIVNHDIDVSAQGFEPGHQIIQQSDARDRKPMLGVAESYVSGSAFKNLYNIERMADCSDPTVFDEIAHNLAVVLNNICVMWSPNAIILGGGVIINAHEEILTRTQKYLAKYLQVFKIPEIALSQYEDDANLIGGLHLLTY
jgi:predicted NBD/HSP70 family sugar kinase